MYQRILVPVDSTSTSQSMLGEAARLAKLCPGAVVRMIHVIDMVEATSGTNQFATNVEAVSEREKQIRDAGKAVLDTAAAAAKHAGFDPELSLVEVWGKGMPDAIVDEAKNWGADIIIMGTHGYGGLYHLLMGSVAEGVLRHAKAPVLLVHSRA